jgi:anti-anti-sigma factor
MDIRLDEIDGATIAYLNGDLTGPACEQVSEALSDILAERGTRMVVDLSNVKLVSSAGLSALVGLTAQANLQESRLVLANANAYVSNVIELTRLNKFFDMAPSVDAAILAANCERVGA